MMKFFKPINLNISKKQIFTFVILILHSFAFAQLEKGDKLYAEYKYVEAIEKYKPIADKGNIRAVRKLAECYRKINDYGNAEKYYEIVVADKNAVPKSFLYYGQILIANEKCKEATIWLEKYLTTKPDADSTLAKALIMTCNTEKKQEDTNRKIIFKNLHGLNSAAADFCAVPYKDGIIFTSARQNKINGTSGSGFQEVLFAKYISDSAFHIEPIKGVVNTKNYNSGPACIDTLHDIIYFTKNNYQYGDAQTNNKGDVTLKIFSAKNNKDSWKDIKELELNDKEYSCAFPSINKEGNMLFFASDRGGGYGGKDIYFSILQNGVWSKPKNAGKNINTAADERYPFIHSDGTLYFSSTGWQGFGGMDIFKSVPNKLGEFGKPENLGKPFNSSTDDFGFYLDGNYENGFLSSDRMGGVGSDDIYQFTYQDIPFELNLYADGKIADSINIAIYANNNLIKQDIASKKFTIFLEPNTVYAFSCSKDGYTTEQFTIKTTNKKKPISKPVNLILK